jgi:hypothetical protein
MLVPRQKHATADLLGSSLHRSRQGTAHESVSGGVEQEDGHPRQLRLDGACSASGSAMQLTGGPRTPSY